MTHLLLAILISASIDSTTIFLGDQTDLHLQATLQKEQIVIWPQYGEMLIPEIEIVDRTIVDTTRLSDGRLQLDQYLTLTSFHDSLYVIPPLPFVAGNDTLWSEQLTLNVIQPFQMDSADMSITDIKPIRRAPIWWWGIFRWILAGILLAGLSIAAWYAWRRWGNKGNTATDDESSEPLRPAEEVALEKLNQIKAEKIWQTGQTKAYHTALTDVIREYISRRFNVRSTEKTSDETLRALKPILAGDNKGLYDSLHKMLQLADLVKFAKWTATPEENEHCLTTAYDFVNETTPEHSPLNQSTVNDNHNS